MVEVTVTGNGTPLHHGSHQKLLWPADETSSPARVDAVIVPTIRKPLYLEEAAKVAAELGCPLVTLHSGRYTSAQEAAQHLTWLHHLGRLSRLELVAIDMPAPERLPLPEFRTSRRLAGTRFARRTDLSAKRNLGLLLSRLMGWERVAFLDDDIRVPDPADLRRAAGQLDVHVAVGLGIEGFPDNSVVCHAYRKAGGSQETFIGGGALVVEMERTQSFFPDIYNEDWFYVLDAEKGLRTVGLAGKAIQQPYDPFRNPDRARAEELGDVLAEGAYWLLDQGRSVADADAEHWRSFIGRRRHFIGQVLDMVNAKVAASPERKDMIKSLRAALGRLELITPELCVGYMADWAIDQATWQAHLQHLASRYKTSRQQPDQVIKLLARGGAAQLSWSMASGISIHHHAPGQIMPRRGPRQPNPPLHLWDLRRDRPPTTASPTVDTGQPPLPGPGLWPRATPAMMARRATTGTAGSPSFPPGAADESAESAT
ncbi:MAG TPA: hypothetical protein VE343_06320 [Streptosporangiaceae bacterium]|nr:hypothetical protein [Streptosporangiaceae bacterium]